MMKLGARPFNHDYTWNIIGLKREIRKLAEKLSAEDSVITKEVQASILERITPTLRSIDKHYVEGHCAMVYPARGFERSYKNKEVQQILLNLIQLFSDDVRIKIAAILANSLPVATPAGGAPTG
ncbi:MAG: hypothetical protein GWP59_02960 [Chlamydiales bacterium]|nr:hypothetical protein [Chlamydiales bacterium]NCF70644.1 hypothetical protein [Chlamydiales bacterium]